jgi:hypothetical protein
MYIAPADAGTLTWNNGTGTTNTGYTSRITGRANTIGLANLIDSSSPYRATRYCHCLGKPVGDDTPGGPLGDPAAVFNFDTGDSDYWSSSEYGSSTSRRQRFSDGHQYNASKGVTLAVHCARR